MSSISCRFLEMKKMEGGLVFQLPNFSEDRELACSTYHDFEAEVVYSVDTLGH
jgi:hypothetical protein